MPWLSLVGIGEDGVDGLSPAASRTIASAEYVVGGRRHLALAAPLIRGETRPWASPIEETFPAIIARRGRPTCVLATGDPFHFGIGVTLARHIPADEMTCLAQPSAFSLAAARLGWAVQDCACVTLHGRALEGIVPHLQPRARVLALSWDESTPRKLAALLLSRGFGPSGLTILEAMGGPAEQVTRSTAAALDRAPGAALNTIAIEVLAAPNARVRPFAPGLPDNWFEHDGQITKSPIRAITLSALTPRPDDILWDVGAGSGSISIEWLLAHPSTKATAIERQAVRAARIARNAAHWGVAERLSLVEGSAPGALSGLPAPDAIFIGGGLTGQGLLDACRTALRSGGRLVVNAVTLESQAVLSGAFQIWGGDLITLSMAQAEPVGAFHGMRPSMTIMQWRLTKA